MRTLLSAFRAAAAVVLMASAVILAIAQGDDQRLAEAKAQTASYLRYFKFESKLAPVDPAHRRALRKHSHLRHRRCAAGTRQGDRILSGWQTCGG